MVKDTTFNGWVNHETWAVNLWLTNDEDTSKQLDKILKNFITPQRKADKLRVMVEGWMYDYIDQSQGFNGNGMFVDLLRGAVNNVNWDAIVEHHKYDFDLEVK